MKKPPAYPYYKAHKFKVGDWKMEEGCGSACVCFWEVWRWEEEEEDGKGGECGFRK